MSTSKTDPFPNHRPNVGIVLFNVSGKVWLGKREAASPPWQWQLPQGGIDDGENPERAALRELEEETGIGADLVEPLGTISDWIAYDYPDAIRKQSKFHKTRYDGQKQRWFAYRYLGSDHDFQLDQHGEVEFEDWRWADLSEITDLVIPWKRDVYRQVVEAFSKFAQ